MVAGEGATQRISLKKFYRELRLKVLWKTLWYVRLFLGTPKFESFCMFCIIAVSNVEEVSMFTMTKKLFLKGIWNICCPTFKLCPGKRQAHKNGT